MAVFSGVGEGAADVFLETERKDLVVFSPEERKRAVEPCLATSMIAAEVVERLGYPTRQCLERWLAKDPRHAGRMRSPIIPMETGQKAIELVLGGMRQKQAARQLGMSVGAVAHFGSRRIARAAWPRCRPGTGMPRAGRLGAVEAAAWRLPWR